MKNSFYKNVIISGISQIIIMVLGFVVPRIILNNYGSDTNGLVSTITQIFMYLALLEAGISQAASNALYKPVQEGDKELICNVTASARYFYKKATIVYGCFVVVLSLALPIFLKTKLSYLIVLGVIFFEGMSNVVSFYFINTWICFLNSSGKSYIVSIFETTGRILAYIVKIILAVNGVNIVIIQFGYFSISLIKFVLYYVYMRNKYPWLKLKKRKIGKLPDRRAYVINQIASTIFSSTDMIVLSVFVSTTLSSVYSVYNMIFLSLSNFLNSIYNSIVYKLGITYHEDIKKYKDVHDMFNIIFISGITIVMATANIMALSFVKLYTNGVTDIDYQYRWLPTMFALVQLLSWSRYVAGNLTGVAGFAKKVSLISIIEASINVVLSLILVRKMGIYGVLVATVCALPIKVIYCNYISDVIIMKRKISSSVKIIVLNFSVFGITILVQSIIDVSIYTYTELFFVGIAVFICIAVIIIIINYLANIELIKRTLLKRGYKK